MPAHDGVNLIGKCSSPNLAVAHREMYVRQHLTGPCCLWLANVRLLLAREAAQSIMKMPTLARVMDLHLARPAP